MSIRAKYPECSKPSLHPVPEATYKLNPLLAKSYIFSLSPSSSISPITVIFRPEQEIFKRLEDKTAYLEKGIRKVLQENQVVFTINRVGSMISVHFDANPVYDFESAKNGDNEHFKKFFHDLLAKGIYIAPSAYETWFITDALTYEDLDYTIRVIQEVTAK